MKAVAPALFLSLSLSAAAMAQPLPDRPSIVVSGTGKATRDPDYALLSFSVRGEGAGSAEALKALADSRARIEGGLATLPGVRVLERRADNISVQDVRSQACMRNGGAFNSLSTGDCAVIGVVGTVNMRLRVAPAMKAGDVASYITQLGGKTVGLQGGGLDTPEVLEREAMRKAIADARGQALLMAEAANAKLGSVLRMQEAAIAPNPVIAAAPPAPPPPPGLAASREELRTPLALSPAPVEVTARVVMTYALEP